MTAAEFTAWRHSAFTADQPGAAKALGIALSTLRAIEQGDQRRRIKRTVALAVRALEAGLKA